MCFDIEVHKYQYRSKYTSISERFDFEPRYGSCKLRCRRNFDIEVFAVASSSIPKCVTMISKFWTSMSKTHFDIEDFNISQDSILGVASLRFQMCAAGPNALAWELPLFRVQPRPGSVLQGPEAATGPGRGESTDIRVRVRALNLRRGGGAPHGCSSPSPSRSGWPQSESESLRLAAEAAGDANPSRAGGPLLPSSPAPLRVESASTDPLHPARPFLTPHIRVSATSPCKDASRAAV
jgi:hypothetical protein